MGIKVVISAIGILAFCRIYGFDEKDFPQLAKDLFLKARQEYLFAYSFLTLSGGLPLLMELGFHLYVNSVGADSFAELSKLREMGRTLGQSAFIFYGIGIVGTLFFHIRATGIDTNKLLYYRMMKPKNS